MALALLGDEETAMRAVALAMTDLARSDISTAPDEARRSLARHVYRRSTELGADTPSMLRPLPAMTWLAQLAQLQRACLALCVFGGHSYQQAADLLGVPGETVAQMLTSGLRELGRLSKGRVATSG
ncbi:sigma factor-like helix-turn-helix DNA-binding protein [Nocardioides sp. LHG3406-4]|uniref:sigma factor-like helix-turn-helix DNA-binding protein n=1 Tax=Nocardioides sp. LHG3406-4 TaxID=2804575 RepID=UPI003CEAC942